jgi:nucleotide-binding universal stress UspA family protein
MNSQSTTVTPAMDRNTDCSGPTSTWARKPLVGDPPLRDWRRCATSGRCVVVGAATTVAGQAATSFAAGEAVRMAARLVAVIGGDRASSTGRAALARIDAVAIAHPSISVEVRWVRDDPAGVLIDLSSRAQLIVLGTHHSTDRWSIRLGPVTEAVLGNTACPVITVGRVHRPVQSAQETVPDANRRPVPSGQAS